MIHVQRAVEKETIFTASLTQTCSILQKLMYGGVKYSYLMTLINSLFKIKTTTRTHICLTNSMVINFSTSPNIS